MEAIQFAEWLAEHHFRMFDIRKGVSFWKSNSVKGSFTTEDLFIMFKGN